MILAIVVEGSELWITLIVIDWKAEYRGVYVDSHLFPERVMTFGRDEFLILSIYLIFLVEGISLIFKKPPEGMMREMLISLQGLNERQLQIWNKVQGWRLFITISIMFCFCVYIRYFFHPEG